MTHAVVTVLCGGTPSGHSTVGGMDDYIDNRENLISPCQAYQTLWKRAQEDIVIYVHDDLVIHDKTWKQTVLPLFDNPECVVVGLGGAVGLGNYDLYRKPFDIRNMARQGYASNQTDAETHGHRFTGTCEVAVVDAFFMAVRHDFLNHCGGWPVDHLTHHCLDLWLACEAERCGKETWLAGIDCTHHGGGASTKRVYAEAKWLQGHSLEYDHILPHKWLYDEYSDVLPIGV